MPPRLDVQQEDRKNLIILLSFGLILRLYAFSQIYMITLDGALQYIPVARLFYEGEYLQALSQPQLPLYPFLISLLSHITGSLEVSGQLISIVFSLFAVFPLYLIGKSLFGTRPAFWTAALYIVNPLMLYSSVDVLKEGVVVFLFFSSVYCSVRFLQEGKPLWLIWTVIFAAVGALGRMSNLVVPLVLGLWLGYSGLRKMLVDRKPVYRYCLIVFLVTGIVAAFVLPGILGWEFVIEKKPYLGISRLFQRWFSNDLPSLSRLGEGIFAIIGRFIEKACILPFLLALFGLGWRLKTKKLSAEEKYLALVMVVLFAIVFAMVLPILSSSERYQLPNIFLFYLWAGFGFVKIGEWIQRKFERYPRLAAVIPAVILLGVMLPFCLQPQRLNKIGRKEVGLWLREQSLSSPLIMTNIPRLVYYAGGEYLPLPPQALPESIVNEGERKGADYLIIEEKGRENADAFASFEREEDLRLVRRHPYGDEGKVIYAYTLTGKSK